MSDQAHQGPSMLPLHVEVEDRFGVLPNFFRLAPQAPEITQNLWGFARFGYLDNPLPPLFKERLFVYLSRFCDVRYCIARHVGFLVGLGHPAGDGTVPPETVEQVLRLIRRPLPRGEALRAQIDHILSLEMPLPPPDPETDAEVAVFACATHVFLQSPDAARCLETLRRAFDAVALQHLLTFLAFVRTAHFWTEVHPELKSEDDIEQLLTVHEALAECILRDPAVESDETTQVLLTELADLRREQQQAELLRVTLASIGDAVIATDRDGRVTTMNAIAEQLTGWTQAEARGRPLDDVFRIINEHTRQPVESPARRSLHDGVIVGLANHTLLIARDGTERPIDDSAAPIRKDGSILGCILVFRDVTERRKNARRLQHSEERYRALVTATSQIVWTTDPDGLVTEDSPAWREFTGQTFEEWQGWGWLTAVHPDDRERIQQLWSQGVETRTPSTFDYRLRRADGTYRWTTVRAVPVLEADGRIREWVGTNTDITERRQAEERLRDSEEKFRLMADTIPQLAWMAHPDGNIFWYNRRWFEYTGTTPQQMEGWGWQSVHDPDVLPGVLERWRGSLASGESFDMVFPLRRADGRFRPFLTRVNPLRDDAGHIRYWFGTNTDISEEQETQRQLREIAARLSDADRRKDEFLATLAHELRNPLAPIRTGLEAMRMESHDPATLQVIRGTMERQTQQLIALVDDLLDVSRITRGRLELRKCRVEMREIVDSAVEASKPAIDEAGHTLSVSVTPQPLYLEADPHRLSQVLSNLLNNAAKYTPEGGHIRLAVVREGSDAVLSVVDNGIGIPAEMRERIFEMFAQIDRPMEKAYTGLGIGLTLVKSLIEMHGGRIDVESAGHGQGSEFRVRLPLLVDEAADAAPPASPTAQAAAAARRRVLIVDDNKAAAQMLSMVIRMLGNEVRTAGDGREGVDVAAEFAPDIVLMDLGMPRMNGYEAARHIRQQPWGQQMVLVALTGWGQDEDKQRTKEAGFDHHLVKPAEPADLQRILATVDQGRS